MRKRILNLGCGDDMYGTDRIDFVKTKATTLVMDLNYGKLPYPSQSFDEVKTWNMIEHIGNVKNLVDECYRILKYNGRINLKTDYAGYLLQ